MVECIDTMGREPGPREAWAGRMSAAMIRGARTADRAAVWSLERIFEWRSRALERHALRSLDDRMLRDVGLSRADLERELQKPFWRW